ncbi:MAG: sigma factor-like helix-turn-helix DNA-binding protein [Candidatus Uhrbacteria bacterium]
MARDTNERLAVLRECLVCGVPVRVIAAASKWSSVTLYVDVRRLQRGNNPVHAETDERTAFLRAIRSYIDLTSRKGLGEVERSFRQILEHWLGVRAAEAKLDGIAFAINRLAARCHVSMKRQRYEELLRAIDSEEAPASRARGTKTPQVPERGRAMLLRFLNEVASGERILPRSIASLDAIVERLGTSIVEEYAGPKEQDWPVSAYALVDTVLELLDPQHRDILRARYELDGKEAVGLRPLGEERGCSGERIRQIAADCIKQLRKPTLRQLLTPVRSTNGGLDEAASRYLAFAEAQRRADGHAYEHAEFPSDLLVRFHKASLSKFLCDPVLVPILRKPWREYIEVPPRVEHIFDSFGVMCMGDVVQLQVGELSSQQGFGDGARRVLEQQLDGFGLQLGCTMHPELRAELYHARD